MRDIDQTLRVLRELEASGAGSADGSEAAADGTDTLAVHISASSMLQALADEGFDLMAAAVRLADDA
jgi:hypothetical protein